MEGMILFLNDYWDKIALTCYVALAVTTFITQPPSLSFKDFIAGYVFMYSITLIALQLIILAFLKIWVV